MSDKKFKIDWNNEAMIRDAIQMLKSNFVENYSVYGYDPIEVGKAWHTIRTSKKAREMNINFSVKRYEAPDTEPNKRLPKSPKQVDTTRPDDVEEAEAIVEALNLSKKSDQMRYLYDNGVVDKNRIAEIVGSHYSHVHSVISKHIKNA